MRKRIKPYKETHQTGLITFEQFMFDKVVPSARAIVGDIGIQIAEDGRIWICVDGIAFLRFKPLNQKLIDALNIQRKELTSE